MNLAHPQLDAVLRADAGAVPSLVIEEQNFFRTLLQDISDQINGLEGETVLSQDDRVLELSRHAELIDSYLGFTLNRKPLLGRILAALEREALSDAHYLASMQLLADVERMVAELSLPFPCSLTCAKLTIGAVWKAAGIEIAEDYDDPLEKLLDYMELVREFDREKLFIFVNLRSFFPDDRVALFLESALGHGFQLLLIDGREYDKLELERRVTVDRDLCEF